MWAEEGAVRVGEVVAHGSPCWPESMLLSLYGQVAVVRVRISRGDHLELEVSQKPNKLREEMGKGAVFVGSFSMDADLLDQLHNEGELIERARVDRLFRVVHED